MSLREKLEKEGFIIDKHGLIKNKGKFENEWYPVVYYYGSEMDGGLAEEYGYGGTELLQWTATKVSEEDKEAIPDLRELSEDETYALLEFSDNGFVCLTFIAENELRILMEEEERLQEKYEEEEM